MYINSNHIKKAEQFFSLHHSEKILVLPNIWEPLGALLLEQLGYKAVATASASMSYTNAVADGENIPLNNLLQQLKTITNSVAIPVSVDFEKGYAENNSRLEENIRYLIEVGAVGINIEDTNKHNNELLSIEVQCEKIKHIKYAAQKLGTPFFVNARTDVYIHGENFSADKKLAETIKRGKAYKDAGADCFYPIVMRDEQHIKTTLEELKMPVNILALSGIPPLKRLNEIGVARVSLGPGFLKIAIKAMKNLATKLQNLEGLNEIVENEITSDYLKELVAKQIQK